MLNIIAHIASASAPFFIPVALMPSARRGYKPSKYIISLFFHGFMNIFTYGSISAISSILRLVLDEYDVFQSTIIATASFWGTVKSLEWFEHSKYGKALTEVDSSLFLHNVLYNASWWTNVLFFASELVYCFVVLQRCASLASTIAAVIPMHPYLQHFMTAIKFGSIIVTFGLCSFLRAIMFF